MVLRIKTEGQGFVCPYELILAPKASNKVLVKSKPTYLEGAKSTIFLPWWTTSNIIKNLTWLQDFPWQKNKKNWNQGPCTWEMINFICFITLGSRINLCQNFNTSKLIYFNVGTRLLHNIPKIIRAYTLCPQRANQHKITNTLHTAHLCIDSKTYLWPRCIVSEQRTCQFDWKSLLVILWLVLGHSEQNSSSIGCNAFISWVQQIC